MIPYFDFLYLIVFLFLVFLILGTFALGGILAAPWVPVPKRDVSRMLRLSGLQKDQKLVDLGCGDGRILIAAARDFGAYAEGFEIAFLPYLVSRVIILKKGLGKRVKVHYRNFFKENLSTADVVTAFLSPRAMEKLQNKFQNELKNGAVVISYAFRMPGWIPEKIDKPHQEEVTIYAYRKLKQKDD